MTKEEVINKLNSLKQYYNDDYDDDEVYVGFDAEDNEAIDMAIKAMEQQPCDDCISRESIIEWLKDKDIIKTKNQEENARRELAELPSVTPQRKRGKWIKIGKDSRGYTDTFECSECGELIRFMFYMDDCEYDYCPYCLADMRGDSE